MGCAARLVKLVKASKDNFSVVVQGLSRVRISEYTQSLPYLKARIVPVEDATTNMVEAEALTMSLKKTAREVLRLIPELPPSAAELLERVDEPGVLAEPPMMTHPEGEVFDVLRVASSFSCIFGLLLGSIGTSRPSTCSISLGINVESMIPGSLPEPTP